MPYHTKQCRGDPCGSPLKPDDTRCCQINCVFVETRRAFKLCVCRDKACLVPTMVCVFFSCVLQPGL
jgi:hypothetical protein